MIAFPYLLAIVAGVTAFALGHLVQSYAAQAVGQRETFRNSIILHQSVGESPVLNFDEQPTAHPYLYCPYRLLHPDEPEEWILEDGDTTESRGETSCRSTESQIPESEISLKKLRRVPARFYRSFVEATAMARIKRDRPLQDVTISGKVWRLCRKKYDIESE